MKSKRHSIFTFCIIAAYVLAVIGFVGILIAKHHEGKSLAEERFNTLTRDLSRSMRAHEIGSKEFYDIFLTSVGTVDDIFSLQIHRDGSLIFCYPASVATPEQSAESSSSLLSAKTTELSSDDGTILKLSATLYTLKPITIFLTGSVSFLVILTTTLACLLYILFFENSDSSERSGDEDDSARIEVSVPELKDVIAKNETAPAAREVPVVQINITPAQAEQAPSESANVQATESQTVFKTTVSPREDAPALKTEVMPLENEPALNASVHSSEKTPVLNDNATAAKQAPVLHEDATTVETKAASVLQNSAQVKEQTPVAQNGDVPAEKTPVLETNVPPAQEALDSPVGLFSPKTGFGWESYMTPRLDKELIRAASSEQDLALFTIRILGIDWNEEYAKKIISLIMETVQFDDLVFEYKDDGCIAILQNMDTDRALQIAEQLNKDILEHLKQVEKNVVPKIGISTRSLRLISGSRLANESEQALLRAIGDKDSPIVAFRVNPEKYRNYLATK